MRNAIVTSCLLLATGCVAKQGRLESNRFQSESYPYAVFYTPDGQPLSPLGPSWRVDNFTYARDGKLAPKDARSYVLERNYDADDDGRPDYSEKEARYDVLLDNVNRDAELWVSTVPIPTHDRDKDLRVLAERYVDAAASEGSVSAAYGEGFQSKPASKGAHVLAVRECTVSKRPAYRVDFDLSDSGSTAAKRQSRGSVVVVRTGYTKQVRVPDGKRADYPVVMLIGLASAPDDHASLEPDFDKLLKQTVLGDLGAGLSMNGETTCGSGSESVPSANTPAIATSGGEQELNPESLLHATPPEMLEPAQPTPAAQP